MTEIPLRVHGLEKSYGDTVAVAGVSFQVEAGEIFGLLGPNGAGKTTTIGCICGLLKPDAGTVTVVGLDVRQRPLDAKRKLGVVPQDLALYDELTVEQNLSAFAGLYGLRGRSLQERIRWCLDFVQLGEFRRRRVGELSGGRKRRLNLSVALLHDPEVVLADEPTVGVDPQSRSHIFQNFEALAGAGKTVVYTTHYMEEVERLCRRAAIIDRGKVVALEILPMREAQAREKIAKGDLTAAIVLPPGFGSRLNITAMFDEEKPALPLLVDPSPAITYQLLEGLLAKVIMEQLGKSFTVRFLQVLFVSAALFAVGIIFFGVRILGSPVGFAAMLLASAAASARFALMLMGLGRTEGQVRDCPADCVERPAKSRRNRFPGSEYPCDQASSRVSVSDPIGPAPGRIPPPGA